MSYFLFSKSKTKELLLSMESVLLKDLNLSPIGPGMYGHCSIEAEEVSFILCTHFLYYFVVVFFGSCICICIGPGMYGHCNIEAEELIFRLCLMEVPL